MKPLNGTRTRKVWESLNYMYNLKHSLRNSFESMQDCNCTFLKHKVPYTVNIIKGLKTDINLLNFVN